VILVDTNAWVQHLRRRDPRLAEFLMQQRVRTCDVVLGELQLGSGMPRDFARLMAALPRVPSPGAEETKLFIERHQRSFAASGVGWADAQILLATAKSGARLHTSDKHVRRVCAAVGVTLV
jgi:predicted nucleic acid-binding protein